MEAFPDELNRRLNLSQWILKFDKHLLAHPEYYKDVKEYFYESYRENYKIRKELHNKFLPEFESNLPFPSKRGFHLYEYYFTPLNFQNMDLSKNYYDTEINIDDNKNNSTKEIPIPKQRSSKIGYDNPFLKDKIEKIKKMNSAKKRYSNLLSRTSKDSINLNLLPFRKRSTKNNNLKLFKRQSMNNDYEYDIDNNDFESIKDSVSGNFETYGKQVDDTDEHTDSRILEESSLSTKNNPDIMVETNDDVNDNSQNNNQNNNTVKKAYMSKRFKRPGNNNQNEDGQNNNDLPNNNKEEENISKNNNENSDVFPFHRQSKSGFGAFKRFSKIKK